MNLKHKGSLVIQLEVFLFLSSRIDSLTPNPLGSSTQAVFPCPSTKMFPSLVAKA